MKVLIVVLLGYSFGTYLAIQYQKAHPAPVEKQWSEQWSATVLPAVDQPKLSRLAISEHSSIATKKKKRKKK